MQTPALAARLTCRTPTRSSTLLSLFSALSFLRCAMASSVRVMGGAVVAGGAAAPAGRWALWHARAAGAPAWPWPWHVGWRPIERPAYRAQRRRGRRRRRHANRGGGAGSRASGLQGAGAPRRAGGLLWSSRRGLLLHSCRAQSCWPSLARVPTPRQAGSSAGQGQGQSSAAQQ
jgi:hypothetical protein